MGIKNLLIFQPTIGSYRVDLFNKFVQRFKTTLYLEYFNSNFEIFDSSESSKSLITKPNILNKSIKIGNRQLYKGYWKVLSEIKPDIVLVSEFGFDAIFAVLFKLIFRKKYKIISICDDSYHMLYTGCDFSKFHKLMRKLVVPLINNLILVEPESCNWYERHYGKGFTFPIISHEQRVRNNYKSSIPLSQQYVSMYGLENNKIIVFIGRLIKIKNVRFLIDGFNKACLPNTKLIIIGNGDESDELKSYASNNNNILFTGRLIGDKLYAWYNLAGVLVLPSVVEPFGAVTNEALIGGCKVLVSENAGSRCLVKDGYNGYTFNPTDQNDFCNKLRIISNEIPSARFSNITLRNSLMTYDFDVESDRLIDYINNL